MTSIVFILPREFQYPRYTNVTIDLAERFSNQFKDLKYLKVEIKIFNLDKGEQHSFIIEKESHDTLYVMIPFVQYDNTSELANEENFRAFINTILLKASMEY